MKTISVLIPTFNEDQNVIPLTAAIIEQFEKYLPEERVNRGKVTGRALTFYPNV